jgi:DNA polymerase-3 subunit delta'
MDLKPANQTNLFGLHRYLDELIDLYNKKKLPNKILLSGQKGIGKSTLAYHLINYVLSQSEDFSYDISSYKINKENKDYKLIQNGSNPNFNPIDVLPEKKIIDVDQIRNLIKKINKSSFNNKPRFVLIDNIEYLNINSVNALLKNLEEPNNNVFFILISTQKKIFPTLKSRCLQFKISLNNLESFSVLNKILENNVYEYINKDLINYYFTPGNIYKLIKFSISSDINLKNISLKDFLKIIIQKNFYKDNQLIKYIIYEYFEFFLTYKFSLKNFKYHKYFTNKMNYIKKFNLDEETFFIEFDNTLLNG